MADVETSDLADENLDAALRALLSAPAHGVKVVITTRVAPTTLLLGQPAVQRRLDLDEGLPSPFAEQVLRGTDPDGRLGVRDAPDELLARARQRTRGLPRALEALVAILAADRDTTLPELLADSAPTPENVVEAMVGEAFSRLDPAAQRVMQALAIYLSAVPAVAVDYLLQPFEPAIDSAPVLARLVNMGFARRDRGRHYLHQADRDYALSHIPTSEASDGDSEAPAFAQRGLRLRAADYFREIRTPPATWRGLDHVSPQLAEFELRYQAGDYDGAHKVLSEIDFDYLMVWGHYALSVDLHERLEGLLKDPESDMMNKGSLADSYAHFGETGRAIELNEQALAIVRQLGGPAGRLNEAAFLSNLGNCYSTLGDIHRAIELYERALPIHQQVGIRFNEATTLGCLGFAQTRIGDLNRAIDFHERALVIAETGKVWLVYRQEDAGRIVEMTSRRGLGMCYALLGDLGQAIELHERALTIAREIGDRDAEAKALAQLGDCHADSGAWPRAAGYCEEAIGIADEVGGADTRGAARVSLARIQLHAGEIDAARETLHALPRTSDPASAPDLALTLGILLARQDDADAAGEAFADAARSSAELLDQARDNYHALDIQALALCGIAIAGERARLAEASACFSAARAIIRAEGVVKRVLRLLDALNPRDRAGILAPIRRTAAGQDR